MGHDPYHKPWAWSIPRPTRPNILPNGGDVEDPTQKRCFDPIHSWEPLKEGGWGQEEFINRREDVKGNKSILIQISYLLHRIPC